MLDALYIYIKCYHFKLKEIPGKAIFRGFDATMNYDSKPTSINGKNNVKVL